MSDVGKKYNGSNHRFYRSLIIAIILITGVMVGFYIFQRMLAANNADNGGDDTRFKNKVAMIVNDSTDVYWKSVYKSAQESGIELGIYIEDFGSELNEEYSTAELVEMAIASKVDGIIMEADNSTEVVSLINEAAALDKPIPIITIGSDATDSSRKSFVSAKDYALGEMYGNQVMELYDGTNQKVVVLLSSNSEQSQPYLIYSGIYDVLTKNYTNIDLSEMVTGESDEFAVEEKVRNLLVSTSNRPDVIVCLSALDTISAYQCVVDYNLVGQVKIIGGYTSPEILEGIEKGNIHSSIVVDTEEMGEKASKGMFDYLISEYVSDYLYVDSNLITKDNVDEYKEKEE